MWFEFRQSNPGGYFDFKNAAYKIFIEADSLEEAKIFAKKNTPIYFNGVSDGIDCPCCGDRWSSPLINSKGTEYINLQLDDEYSGRNWMRNSDDYMLIIYYRNGDIKKITAQEWNELVQKLTNKANLQLTEGEYI